MLAYLLAISTFLLTFGRLGDMLGLKRVYLAGFVIFVAGSLACAFSWNIWALVAVPGRSGRGCRACCSPWVRRSSRRTSPLRSGARRSVSWVSRCRPGWRSGPTLGGLIIGAAGLALDLPHQPAGGYRRVRDGLARPAGAGSPRTALRSVRGRPLVPRPLPAAARAVERRGLGLGQPGGHRPWSCWRLSRGRLLHLHGTAGGAAGARPASCSASASSRPRWPARSAPTWSPRPSSSSCRSTSCRCGDSACSMPACC